MLSICFISLMTIRPFSTDIPVHINVGQIHYIQQEIDRTFVFIHDKHFNTRETAPEILKRIRTQCVRKK